MYNEYFANLEKFLRNCQLENSASVDIAYLNYTCIYIPVCVDSAILCYSKCIYTHMYTPEFHCT